MSSKGGGGGAGKGNNGVSTIPAASRKMVQSLKEIVNCPEAEIYAALKDCNMDPNEAVNRLLSQGLLSFSLFFSPLSVRETEMKFVGICSLFWKKPFL